MYNYLHHQYKASKNHNQTLQNIENYIKTSNQKHIIALL